MQQSNRNTKHQQMNHFILGFGLASLATASLGYYAYKKKSLLSGTYRYAFYFSNDTLMTASCLFVGRFYRYQTQSETGRKVVQIGRYEVEGKHVIFKRHDGYNRIGMLSEDHRLIDFGDGVILSKKK
ncbi:hypothetical protein NFX39_00760 [Fructobacillus sp. W13]|uniref:Uncharacterized protein n=1 Tax=Fructobacillus apis TaxID=2935017 RepID=A0ABT0ZNQ7_9LACO|nr:hypothetical protein [Fructobacillus apis]MCO0831625.1 hypothetical protein [Fructobacillus apis]